MISVPLEALERHTAGYLVNSKFAHSWHVGWRKYMSTLTTGLKRHRSQLMLENFVPIEELIFSQNSTTLSQQLGGVIARYIVLTLECPVLFLPLHSALQLLEDKISDLVRLVMLAQDGSDKEGILPCWHFCVACNARVRGSKNNGLAVFGCRQCGNVTTIDYELFLGKPVSSVGCRFAPSVLLDYLIDYYGYDILAGTCYETGAAKMREAQMLAAPEGRRPPPDIPWKLSLACPGPAELLSFMSNYTRAELAPGVREAVRISTTGRASMLYYAGLPSFGTAALLGLKDLLAFQSPSEPLDIELPARLMPVELQREVRRFLRSEGEPR